MPDLDVSCGPSQMVAMSQETDVAEQAYEAAAAAPPVPGEPVQWRDLHTCGECGATVDARYVRAHHEWHENLWGALNLGGKRARS